MKVRRIFTPWAVALVLIIALMLVAPVVAEESPPSGIPPNEFSTEYQGCLGQLRSLIAQGEFAGVEPFGEHFTGDVNPGAHQGTVGEEEFLAAWFGLEGEELKAFCAQFEP